MELRNGDFIQVIEPHDNLAVDHYTLRVTYPLIGDQYGYARYITSHPRFGDDDIVFNKSLVKKL